MADETGGTPSGVLPDLAYLVHETENEPLRYSIRSVAQNCSGLYGNIWIVGNMPDWLQGVGHIPSPRGRGKFVDIRNKVEALCADDRVADQVVILNDDYYATEKITTWETYHMGLTSEYLKGKPVTSNTWFQALKLTAEWMERQGYGDILCYEGHVPLLFDRHKLGEIISRYPAKVICDYPGFYPAAGAAGEGVRATNAKIVTSEHFHERIGTIPWASSNDASFADGLIGGFIRGLFRTPSQYEL